MNKKFMNEKCIHDLSEQSTLKKSSKRLMVLPDTINCVCTVCKKKFSFIKNEQGKYSLTPINVK